MGIILLANVWTLLLRRWTSRWTTRRASGVRQARTRAADCWFCLHVRAGRRAPWHVRTGPRRVSPRRLATQNTACFRGIARRPPRAAAAQEGMSSRQCHYTRQKVRFEKGYARGRGGRLLHAPDAAAAAHALDAPAAHGLARAPVLLGQRLAAGRGAGVLGARVPHRLVDLQNHARGFTRSK